MAVQAANRRRVPQLGRLQHVPQKAQGWAFPVSLPAVTTNPTDGSTMGALQAMGFGSHSHDEDSPGRLEGW